MNSQMISNIPVPNTSGDALVYFAVSARDAAPMLVRLHDLVAAGRLTLAAPEAVATARGMPKEGGSESGTLTERQREVLGLLAQQLSNKEIARKLSLSHFTVRNHVSQLLRLLKVPTRKAAIALLSEKGHPAGSPAACVASASLQDQA